MNLRTEWSFKRYSPNSTHRHAFCSCDLDLDPMTLIYENVLDILKTCALKTKFLGQGFQKFEYEQDRQTDTI